MLNYVDYDLFTEIINENEDTAKDILLNRVAKSLDINNLISSSIKNTDIRVSTNKDSSSQTHRFTIKPQGIVIQDTYNNFITPIRPNPRIDTSKFDLLRVIRTYRELYTDFKPVFLPWHYCVEFVHDRYFVINTRPLTQKYPLDTNYVLNNANKKTWDENTHRFFNNNLFNINMSIHICVIGDSNLDVYPNKFYNLVGRTCISPLITWFKIIKGGTNNIFPLNMGPKFNITLLNRFNRK